MGAGDSGMIAHREMESTTEKDYRWVSARFSDREDRPDECGVKEVRRGAKSAGLKRQIIIQETYDYLTDSHKLRDTNHCIPPS